MATVLELARYASVPAAQVLRVLNGRPVSGDVRARVEEAIAALGHPDGAAERPGVEVLPAHPATAAPAPSDATDLALLAASSETVGTVVYEALRIEVRPVAEHVSQVGRLVDDLVDRLADLQADAKRQRGERIEDLKLLTELVTEGWRAVDRRIGRLERMVERMQAQSNGNGHRPPSNSLSEIRG